MPIAAATMPPSAIGVSNTRVRAVFLLQARGDPEDAAEIADILAEHDDVGIARHHHVVGAVERLDHVHDGHLRFASASATRRAARRGARAAPRTRPRTSIDVLVMAVAERAVLLGLLLRGADLVAELLLERLVPLLVPFAEADQMRLQPRDRIAERPFRAGVLRAGRRSGRREVEWPSTR